MCKDYNERILGVNGLVLFYILYYAVKRVAYICIPLEDDIHSEVYCLWRYMSVELRM